MDDLLLYRVLLHYSVSLLSHTRKMKDSWIHAITWMKPQNTVWKEDARETTGTFWLHLQEILKQTKFISGETNQTVVTWKTTEKRAQEWAWGGAHRPFKAYGFGHLLGIPEPSELYRCQKIAQVPLKLFCGFSLPWDTVQPSGTRSQDPFILGQGRSSALALPAGDVTLSFPTSST